MFVSVITSTRGRRRFIPRLIEMYKGQTYPREKMEWIILDDGLSEERVGDLVSEIPGVRYLVSDIRLTMGEKLNRLNKAVNLKSDCIVVMDDDDYYPPERISSVVQAFMENPTIDVVGCSKVYLYYTGSAEIFCAGPYHSMHALNCTLAYRTSYSSIHQYDSNETCAVEKAFLCDFTEPMIQLNSKKTILHIIHSSNTYITIKGKGKDKNKIGLLRKTKYRLEDFIKEASMRSAFIEAF